MVAITEARPETDLLLETEANPELGVREMLEAKWAEGKFLCVGLDVTSDSTDIEHPSLFDRARMIVDATRDVAAAYKPNSAFYEDENAPGYRQLEELVGYIKELAPDIPVIWDAKRADIAKTNEGYANAAEHMGVDGITIHPYLGGTAVKPLLSDPKKVGFVLGHTSNPGAHEFQHLELKSGELLWERVVGNVAHSPDWQHGSVLGVVTGATYPEELAKARWIVGDEVVMLIPGVGTQGGDLEASVRGAMNSRGNGFLINVSSGISGAKDKHDQITLESVRSAAIDFHEKIHAVWQDAKANPTPDYGARMILEFNSRLASALIEAGAIQFGEFTLKSGKKSPIYVNLRDTISDPTLRGDIVNIYIDMIKALEARRGEQFDVLSGIPQAVTSFAAIVADRMERRLVQPRSGVKDHGIQTLVEGIFAEGESVGLMDDLITEGGSKLETINQLERAGLKLGGIALLVDREQSGFLEMAARGFPIIAATKLRSLIIAGQRAKKITKTRRDEVLAYFDESI